MASNKSANPRCSAWCIRDLRARITETQAVYRHEINRTNLCFLTRRQRIHIIKRIARLGRAMVQELRGETDARDGEAVTEHTVERRYRQFLRTETRMRRAAYAEADRRAAGHDTDAENRRQDEILARVRRDTVVPPTGVRRSKRLRGMAADASALPVLAPNGLFVERRDVPHDVVETLRRHYYAMKRELERTG
ncbi:hypothetical protein JX265_010322 [Neoarthrinium moseri]|uniref:Uncharacterized protein n=1 Tax=Neoarthrinium moseri TaxID=1658444 RepID=A0A9P9WF29_9PEZI|nr:uncharacterized protein JN550_003480 [Neoarthrinium moseri]KAI1844264.1 hypothetical protein JX266_009555 [Neoarthrinium moseri]KAI1859873.1 hypothetical protein JX265_010322 [Neoarthrinium moseri]KAI1873227.1 hypothetical protein JN550_003480 [Neoarthrinium moseri]